MANEIRTRVNFVAGGLSADMAAAATTMNSAGLADMPVVDTTNHIAVAFFRTDLLGRVTQKEIVWVTAHASGATVATVIRSRESTTAQDWVSGDRWSCTELASDNTSIVTSTARPGNPYKGMEIYETDTGAKKIYDGSNWQTIGGTPVGTIIWKASSNVPLGYLRVDGSLKDRTTYADLFAEIGFQYSPTPGTDPGSNQFYLPNAPGRAFVMRDAAQTEFDTMGELVGSKTSTAPHTHTAGAHTHTLAHTHDTNGVSVDHAHNVYSRSMNTGWMNQNWAHWHGARIGNTGWNGLQSHGHYNRGGYASEAPWEGGNVPGGSIPVNVDSVDTNHYHDATHDHPSTNYATQSPWAGNTGSHSHTTNSQTGTTTSAPSADATGPSSAAVTSGNIQPSIVLDAFIKF